MTYNLSIELHRNQFILKARKLLEKGAAVELKEKTARSLSQNAYLHLLIGAVAMETGNTLEDTKAQYFKKLVNPDIFCVKHTDKLGRTIEHLRSSAEVEKDDMSKAIDRFLKWGDDNKIYLPRPNDKETLKAIEIELGRYDTWV